MRSDTECSPVGARLERLSPSQSCPADFATPDAAVALIAWLVRLAAPIGSFVKSAPACSVIVSAARPSAALLGAEQDKSPSTQNWATRPVSVPKSEICCDL